MSSPLRLSRPLALLGLLFAGFAAHAQPPQIPSAATVGVPYTFDFGQSFQGIPTSISGGGETVQLTWAFTASGSLPPGMTLTSEGLLSGTPSTAGTYNFNITLSFSITASGLVSLSQTVSEPPFPYTITVGGSSGPQISVQPGLLSFSFVSGASAATQAISVVNHGSQAATFSAVASTITGGNWLSASASGSAPAFGSGGIQVTADPTGVPPGTYGGSVSVTVGTTTAIVSVVMTVTSTQQILTLSQAGLTFRAIAGGGAPPPQTISVLNTGSGSLSWTQKTSTLSGGAAWLSASPASGTSAAGALPAVQVAVNPAGLAAGDYYGQIQISADGVSNSPQTVSVVLTVAPATTSADPVVQPTGLIFVGAAGGANPAAKTFTMTNLTSKAVTYTTAAFFDTGKDWYSAKASNGTVNPNEPATISVQPALAGLTTGVYTGDVAIHFVETNTTRHVAILLVVAPAGTALSPKLAPLEPRSASGCTASKLLPVFTQLGQSFTTTAAWPTSIELTVVDDCGTPMTSGSVVTTFSSGDPLLPLTSLGDGRWTGTWQARNATTVPVTITASAQLAAPPLVGKASIGGSSQANATTPSVKDGGVISAVSFSPLAPLAPGSLASISGSNLASSASLSTQPPLNTQLNGTQAIIAGRSMPLFSTADGQINGVIPFDVPVNSTHQLIIQRGNAYSVPVNVTVATAGPAVFTQDMSGTGAASVVGTDANGNQYVVNDDNPASEGDTLVITCAGLGAVDPPVASGIAAPDSPASATTNPVTVTIGGQDAPVAFAGLTPGLVGIYQVNTAVPSGVTPGDAPLVVNVAGQSSQPAVTIAVQ
jgi:uncharacterized protein (TIGR03437 family)